MLPRPQSSSRYRTMVQPKNITFPADATLLNGAHQILVWLGAEARRQAAPILRAAGQIRPDRYQRYALAKHGWAALLLGKVF